MEATFQQANTDCIGKEEVNSISLYVSLHSDPLNRCMYFYCNEK